MVFKKIIFVIIILSFITGFSGNIFYPGKAYALAPGEAMGKAIAAGASCFMAVKIEGFVAGLLTRYEPGTMAEGHAQALKHLEYVPTIDASAPAVAKSVETSNALSKSKECIRDVVAKILLDYVVDETIKWVQGGGKPSFVTDWEGFLKDAWQVGVGEVISQTNAAFLCSPFKLKIQMSLFPTERYSQRIRCTLDDVVENIEDFYDDFNTGGWIAYNTMWEPNNNFIGVSIIAHDEALIRASKKTEASVNEAISGNGFLSVKKCVERDTEQQMQLYDVCMEQKVADISDYGQRVDVCAKEAENHAKCLKEEIVTPGDTVGQAVAKAVTSDTEWAANVKSWVAALTNAVINRVITEGISKMQNNEYNNEGQGNLNSYTYIDDPDLIHKKEYIDNMNAEYQTIIDRLKEVLSSKKSSVFSNEQSLYILSELKKRDCQPTVSDYEFTDLNTKIDKLNSEIADTQKIINEAQDNLEQNKNISDDYRDTEVVKAENRYNNFIRTYNSTIVEVYNGSAQLNAKDEANAAQADLNIKQNRLNICVNIR